MASEINWPMGTWLVSLGNMSPSEYLPLVWEQRIPSSVTTLAAAEKMMVSSLTRAQAVKA